MEGNALNEKKMHVKDALWIDTLRTGKSIENFYSEKFVEKIVKDSENFAIKGRDKLQLEMQWIDEKDRAGYSFAFMDSLAIKPAKINR